MALTPRQLQAPASIAEHVAELLSDPARFTTETQARDKHGDPVHARSELAVSWCVLGAIHHASRASAFDARAVVIRAISRELRTSYLTEFNDSVKGARKRIVAAAKRAAKSLRAS